ncbi:RNA-binding protein Musashi 2 [Sarracenia purpurea var. burkii]
MGEEEETGVEQVQEEFTVWKKNTPFLYDLVISHPLEWPSLTVQWLPSPAHPDAANGSFAIHKLILGTHTSDEFPNFLMVADVHLPCNPASETPTDPAGPSHESAIPKVEIVQKIHVDGEVNRARCMVQNTSIVATKTSECQVYVFDCTKHTMEEQGGSCEPDLRLKGHDKEGYGLSWSPFKEGYLLSGSNDCKICLWDVSSTPQDKFLDATHVYEVNLVLVLFSSAHGSVVEDVAWHLKNENLFGSVGDDCYLMIWDLRTNKTQHSVQAHEKEVNYLSFNPFNDWVVATASSDTTVSLFDIRKLTSPLHVLSSHT